jgi:ADP-ribosylglycohydrolase
MPPPPPPPAPRLAAGGKLPLKKYVRQEKKKSAPRPPAYVAPLPPPKSTAPPANFDAKRKRARDRALGALIGASIGDAIGSFLEFQHDYAYSSNPVLPTPERVREALRMPGNGPPHFLASGQVTDDQELALALASVLKGHDPRAGLPREDVWKVFHAWIESGPFDVGVSTRAAFEPSRRTNARVNPKNESNGDLMRIAPLAVWAAKLSDADIAKIVDAETMLSHSSTTARIASATYAISLASLVRGEGPAAARRRALEFLKTVSNPVTARKIRGWIVAEHDPSDENAMRSAGWLKHGFRLAFFHLKRGSTFRSGIRHTLLVGGDTDTNACIVGAFLGARDGFSKLPPLWKRRVLTANTNHGRHPRPLLYHPHRYVAFVNSSL